MSFDPPRRQQPKKRKTLQQQASTRRNVQNSTQSGTAAGATGAGGRGGANSQAQAQATQAAAAAAVAASTRPSIPPKTVPPVNPTGSRVGSIAKRVGRGGLSGVGGVVMGGVADDWGRDINNDALIGVGHTLPWGGMGGPAIGGAVAAGGAIGNPAGRELTGWLPEQIGQNEQKTNRELGMSLNPAAGMELWSRFGNAVNMPGFGNFKNKAREGERTLDDVQVWDSMGEVGPGVRNLLFGQELRGGLEGLTPEQLAGATQGVPTPNAVPPTQAPQGSFFNGIKQNITDMLGSGMPPQGLPTQALPPQLGSPPPAGTTTTTTPARPNLNQQYIAPGYELTPGFGDAPMSTGEGGPGMGTGDPYNIAPQMASPDMGTGRYPYIAPGYESTSQPMVWPGTEADLSVEEKEHQWNIKRAAELGIEWPPNDTPTLDWSTLWPGAERGDAQVDALLDAQSGSDAQSGEALRERVGADMNKFLKDSPLSHPAAMQQFLLDYGMTPEGGQYAIGEYQQMLTRNRALAERGMLPKYDAEGNVVMGEDDKPVPLPVGEVEDFTLNDWSMRLDSMAQEDAAAQQLMSQWAAWQARVAQEYDSGIARQETLNNAYQTALDNNPYLPDNMRAAFQQHFDIAGAGQMQALNDIRMEGIGLPAMQAMQYQQREEQQIADQVRNLQIQRAIQGLYGQESGGGSGDFMSDLLDLDGNG